MKRYSTYCGLCISRCGCIASVEDGRLVKVERDPLHPTGGAICIKAKTAPEFVHHAERLTMPLLRTAPKGSADPMFRPIGWDEALDLAAAKLRAVAERLGPEGVAFAITTPSGTAIADSFGWIHRLAHAFGSPNLVFATENCNWHKDFTPMLTWGAGIGMPDYARTGLVLLWGFNPSATWLAQVEPIRAAQRRGARVVAIDPRRQGLARSADLWLGLRPGTDGALALGLAHLLLESGCADEEFLAAFTDAPFLVRDDNDRLLTDADLGLGRTGAPILWDRRRAQPLLYDRSLRRASNSAAEPALFGTFRVSAGDRAIPVRPVLQRLKDQCAGYTPERVEAITGVAAASIRQLAAWLHESGPVSFFTWTGTAQHANATQTARAIHILYALTGCLDAAGGNVWFSRPPITDIAAFDLVSRETRAASLGLDERPLGPPQRGWTTTRDLFRAIESDRPYPIRALVSFGGNFALTKPRTRHAQEALAKLDFFVMTELFLTPSCREADLVLPVASCWEREGLQAGFMTGAEAEQWIQLRPAVVPPVGASRSDTTIVFQFAERLGLGAHFFGGDEEAALAHVLAPAGLSPDDLRKEPQGRRLDLPDGVGLRRRTGFATASGRVELYAERLLSVGEDALPAYVLPRISPEATPALAADYPLRLTCAKWPQFCHSQQRQSSSIRKAMPRPLVQLHPADAALRGIADGTPVRVSTPDGSFRAFAVLEPALTPQVVCAQYGWWRPEHPGSVGELSYNAAIDGEIFDPVSGSNALRSTLCNVVALGPGPEPAGGGLAK